MDPTLKIGDIAIIKEVTEEELVNDDIITFMENGVAITHRIVENEENELGNKYYKTKGDNNNANDIELVEYEDIEGKYIFRIPQIGKIIISAKTTLGMIIIVSAMCIIYMIIGRAEDKKIARHEKREKFEKR